MQEPGSGRLEVTETFRNLIVWQKAKALAKTVYVASASFPKEEAYGLTIQNAARRDINT